MQSTSPYRTEPLIEAVPPDGARETLAGRYRLRRLIAKTESALVYAAEDNWSAKTVAVKLARSPSHGHAAIRLRREIHALAKVRTDGIVEMLDSGEVRGRPYIVLEMLEGRTLAGLLAARGRLTVAEAIGIGIQLAAALERCHACGVVHRDIKPSNLFIIQGSVDNLKLLDFGIAKLADTDACGPKLTRDNTVLGTPEYMAPEALLSKPDTDHRVDMYGVGVTLYECLTGAVPHEGEYGRVLLEVFTTPVRPVHEVCDDVPFVLSEIVRRCLARSPEDRFQTMSELRAALEACQRLFGGARPGQHWTSQAETQQKAVRRAEPVTLAATPQSKLLRSVLPRRKHPRAAYTTPARIHAQVGVVDGRIEEVSEGGLQFLGARAIPTGETVTIRFALPVTGRIAQVTAIARWNHLGRAGQMTGLELVKIAEASRDELRQYLVVMCPEAA